MGFTKTTRPGLIQLKVLDMDKSLPVYRDILGLDEVGKTRVKPVTTVSC